MQEPPSREQRKYKAQAFLAGGLALYSPLGLLAMNIYPYFAHQTLNLTMFTAHFIIGLVMAIFGNHFLNKGYDILRQANYE